MNSVRVWLILLLMACLGGCEARSAAPFSATRLVGGLEYPWSMVFLPDGEILVAERAGQLRRIRANKLLPGAVTGLPKVSAQGQGGLLGLALHPDFATNRWLYIAYSAAGQGGFSTELARARYIDGKLTERQLLFVATPKVQGGAHFGGRIVFDRQGYLFLTLGDRGERELAQDTSYHAGSVIRLHDDGRIPATNPFVNRPGFKPEIYSYGHRNIQGAALNPLTGQLWTHEHGPQGGDELNLLKAGANYGWPDISYGEEYGGGRIGQTQQAGMEQPVYYWVPSIAPSGLSFYTGNRYAGWKGNALVGSLKFSLLARLTLVGNKVVAEERLLEDKIGRIRDVQQGPDEYVYLLTDEPNGGLYRLESAQ